MASGQNYSKYQQGVIKRYYEHADTRVLTKLAELVSDLYLADTPKKAEKLWASAEKHLTQAKLKPDRVRRIVDARDVKALAAAVSELGS